MKDLRDFIKLLRDHGQLAIVDTPVDPVLEITEIADRVVKAGGPGPPVHASQGAHGPGVHQSVRQPRTHVPGPALDVVRGAGGPGGAS